VWCRSGRRRVQ